MERNGTVSFTVVDRNDRDPVAYRGKVATFHPRAHPRHVDHGADLDLLPYDYHHSYLHRDDLDAAD